VTIGIRRRTLASFDEWFTRATGNFTFSYQRRFATEG
jgi:hypothetical protein